MRAASSTHFSVIRIGIDAYDRRRSTSQIDLKRGLRETFSAACNQIGISPAEPPREDESRLRALFTSDVSTAVLATDLPRELDYIITERNRSRNALGTLRLIFVAATGRLRIEGSHWVGPALDRTTRIIEAGAVQLLTQAAPEATVFELLSPEMHDEVLDEENRGLDLEKFVPFALSRPEHSSGLRVWTSLWNHGQIHPPSGFTLPDPEYSSEHEQKNRDTTGGREESSSTAQETPITTSSDQRNGWVNHGSIGTGDHAIVIGNNHGHIDLGKR
ncbi:hypothetical protein MXD62_07080 [Frankia sp. Mgl5]|uniref:hypothetical protein n=1 Tax=Frankia sp. Mgl5 TaxID=2933793 RepID=UPI00200D1ECE|nr:hypothetical protein [Frankia sp. Mgl5]MCK9926931.1 hypothetical protein [Frankia sp. Mgl5]